MGNSCTMGNALSSAVGVKGTELSHNSSGLVKTMVVGILNCADGAFNSVTNHKIDIEKVMDNYKNMAGASLQPLMSENVAKNATIVASQVGGAMPGAGKGSHIS